MACPYFYPVARMDSAFWGVPPRLPLGDAYAGECRAQAAAFQPDETIARQFCNVGYGRGCCERFPGDAEADAVRFHIVSNASEPTRLQYVFERDGWPGKQGIFDWPLASQEFPEAPANSILRRQAVIFIESYRRRSAK